MFSSYAQRHGDGEVKAPSEGPPNTEVAEPGKNPGLLGFSVFFFSLLECFKKILEAGKENPGRILHNIRRGCMDSMYEGMFLENLALGLEWNLMFDSKGHSNC